MNFVGIENRTSWPNTGEITVNDAGAAAGLSACEGMAEAASKPIATMAANFVGAELIARRLALLNPPLRLIRAQRSKLSSAREPGYRRKNGGHGADRDRAHPSADRTLFRTSSPPFAPPLPY